MKPPQKSLWRELREFFREFFRDTVREVIEFVDSEDPGLGVYDGTPLPGNCCCLIAVVAVVVIVLGAIFA
jgi:hypothetical protein